MAGFDPVGSSPVAAIGSASAPGTYFTPTTGTLIFAGYAPFVSMTVGPPRVSWMGAEVLLKDAGHARAGWIGAEVLLKDVGHARLGWVGVEVLRDPIGLTLARVTAIYLEVLRTINPDTGFVYLVC